MYSRDGHEDPTVQSIKNATFKRFLFRFQRDRHVLIFLCNHASYKRTHTYHTLTNIYRTTHLYINMFVDTYYVVGAVGPMANPISEASDTISAARANKNILYCSYKKIIPEVKK